ncbi:MAG: hypothetical protein Q9170_001386 [Blastenia crenularia]
MDNSSDQSRSFSILQWRDDVSSTIRARSSPDRLSGRSKHHPSNRRPSRYLAEVSANPQKHQPSRSRTQARKRKRNMEEEEDYSLAAAPKFEKRGRGRPPKNEKQYAPQTIPIRAAGPSSTTSQSSRARSKSQSQSQSRKGSRSRKGKGKEFHDIISIASITMAHLQFCDPPVVKRTLNEIKHIYRADLEDKAKVGKAADLYWKLEDIPHAVIPSSLKASYEAAVEDTPDKSRRGPRNIDYHDHLPYPPHRLATLKQIVDSVLKKTAWNHKRGAHERQWGATINLLLEEFTLWPREVEMKALNVENCTVDIEGLRTKLNSGQILSYKTESVAARTDDGSDEPNQSVSKMVDWTLAIDLDDEDEDIIDRAFNKMNSGECSLNQSSSYIRKSALFTDFELKKPYAGGDPGVQLALWESGALLKRRWHNWDTSIPMPGVFVDGHVWHWCLFVALGKGLVMLGPFLMGTTETIVGVWQIIYRLNVIVGWGTTTYNQWFQDNVMTWARRRVAIAEGRKPEDIKGGLASGLKMQA